MKMNTQQLECFTTLAKTLNYAKTAEQLSLSQPAVSRQIQSLETELNAKLFNRTTRSVSLTPLLSENANIVPELTLDQTDANLHRLSVHQLDLVIGMKDAKFTADDIVFQKLREDAFVCVVNKQHPLAQKCKKRRQKSVSSADIWPYRQIIDIPPYLLKHVFSRGHHIVPVNDELDNIICATTSEAYNLALAGAGFALIPGHLILPHKELVFLPWEESPHAPMGIYYRQQAAIDKNSAIYKFICTAENYISKLSF